MGQFVVENAHLRIDREKYAESYERIFGDKKSKKSCECTQENSKSCDICQKIENDQDTLKTAQANLP